MMSSFFLLGSDTWPVLTVLTMLHWHRKEIDGWITEKMAQMAHMSCEQLKATIREMEAIEQMFTSEKRMEKAARAHITSPELTIRRTVQWRISNVSGNRLTSAILQPSPQIHKLRGIKAQVEEQIRNCLLQVFSLILTSRDAHALDLKKKSQKSTSNFKSWWLIIATEH